MRAGSVAGQLTTTLLDVNKHRTTSAVAGAAVD